MAKDRVNRLMEFDLKVGDVVEGQDKCHERVFRRKWKVIGIYRHIFQCRALGAEYNLEQAFGRVEYQMGEVLRV